MLTEGDEFTEKPVALQLVKRIGSRLASLGTESDDANYMAVLYLFVNKFDLGYLGYVRFSGCSCGVLVGVHHSGVVVF